MFSYLNPLPHLPAYPYAVGTREVEIPISEIQSSSQSPDPQISTIKFRLYYPTTSDAKSNDHVYWLPEPQKEWNDAYADFMGSSSGWRNLLATNALSILKYVKLPAVKNAAPLPGNDRLPVCIFSHGLGGNFNTYSSICGTLASCGIICAAPEHRDGSAPISFLRNDRGQFEGSIPYQKHSHAPTKEVLDARDAQLRVRSWELDVLYKALKDMNDGKQFTNYAAMANNDEKENWTKSSNILQSKLNLAPGKVSWVGHSFGAATICQFTKSVFYHKHLPESSGTKPLYACASDSDLIRQITPESPIALLDLWTMPLRSETTRWLWERPLPCYHCKATASTNQVPNTVAMISSEFYKWTDLLNRTIGLLSKDPISTMKRLESRKDDTKTIPPSNDNTRAQNPIPELSKQTSESAAADASRSPSPSPSSSMTPSAASSQISLVPSEHDTISPCEPHLYHVDQSAHLSQSDFGVLFPNLTKYVMKAIEPEKTLQLNIRAILAVMKGQGLPVRSLMDGVEEDQILTGEAKESRWKRIPLST